MTSGRVIERRSLFPLRSVGQSRKRSPAGPVVPTEPTEPVVPHPSVAAVTVDPELAVDLLTSPVGGADAVLLRRLRRGLRRRELESGGGRSSDELLAEALGERVYDFYLRNKRSEWEAYRGQVSMFERDQMLPVI